MAFVFPSDARHHTDVENAHLQAAYYTSSWSSHDIGPPIGSFSHYARYLDYFHSLSQFGTLPRVHHIRQEINDNRPSDIDAGDQYPLPASYAQFGDPFSPPARGLDQNHVAPGPLDHPVPPPNVRLPGSNTLWSPNYESSADHPIGYRAPVLPPAHVRHQGRAPSLSTMDRPPAYGAGIIVFDDVPNRKRSLVETNTALSAWYVDQVISLLVYPGQHLVGNTGQLDEIWGSKGRMQDAWLRVGKTPPGLMGRIGLLSTFGIRLPGVRRRGLDAEMEDPWNLLIKRSIIGDGELVNFVYEIIQRMSVNPVTVIAALWFLKNLGFHPGDGPMGAQMRDSLRKMGVDEPGGTEKRVAMLGLILAGKWLDDNSFLSKSWSDVARLPREDVVLLERHALASLHFSLFVPLPLWADHVNQLWSDLLDNRLHQRSLDDIVIHEVVTSILDGMVTQARELEMADRRLLVEPTGSERRQPLQGQPAAADQAIDRDWSAYVRPYSLDTGPLAQEATIPVPFRPEMEEDDEEDFVEYDGALPWLQPAVRQDRSLSDASTSTVDSIQQWRDSVLPVYLSPPVTISRPSSPVMSKMTIHPNPSVTSVVRPEVKLATGIQEMPGSPSGHCTLCNGELQAFQSHSGNWYDVCNTCYTTKASEVKLETVHVELVEETEARCLLCNGELQSYQSDSGTWYDVCQNCHGTKVARRRFTSREAEPVEMTSEDDAASTVDDDSLHPEPTIPVIQPIGSERRMSRDLPSFQTNLFDNHAGNFGGYGGNQPGSKKIDAFVHARPSASSVPFSEPFSSIHSSDLRYNSRPHFAFDLDGQNTIPAGQRY